MTDTDPLPFENVPAGDFSETNQKYKLICSRHGAAVCGQCCTDFSLFNQLRYDRDYLLATNETEREDRIARAVVQYVDHPAPIENPSQLPFAPHLPAFLGPGLTDRYQCVGEFTSITAHLCFAYRNARLQVQDQLVMLLKNCLEKLPDVPNARMIVQLEHGMQLKRKKEKQEKTRRKVSGQEKDYVSKVESVQKDIDWSVQNMLLCLSKACVSSRGVFFEEYVQVHSAMKASPVDSPESLLEGLEINGDTFNIRPDVQARLEPQLKWINWLQKHSGPVPIGEPSEWPLDPLVGFLHQHDVVPEPLPSRAVLVEIARQLVRFSVACAVTINDLPKGKDVAALVRHTKGVATDSDEAIAANFFGPPTRMTFVLDAQVPPGFEISPRTTDWPSGSGTEAVFAIARKMHSTKFEGSLSSGQTYNKVLRILEAVAHSFDAMQNGVETDLIVQYRAGEGTPGDQSMAIRVLGTRQLDELESPTGRLPLPVLIVEFLHGRGRENTVKSMLSYVAGMRKETCKMDVQATVEETELLLTLLRENRKQLSQDDQAYKQFEKKASKGWKVSLLRPCDPERKGGAKICPPCGKRATKVCGRCKNTAYCCIECQHSDWKVHKKSCRKPS